MSRHTSDCGALHPRGCRPNCNCWCHDNQTVKKLGKERFVFENKNKIVCKICIMQKGLKGSDLFAGKCPYAFDNEKDFIKHLKDEHNLTVVGGKGK
jgi:hypothetical protein